MTKVLFLLTQDLQSPSGLGRYLPWAKQLARFGFEVSVVALHPDFAHFQEKHSLVDGVKVGYVAQMHIKKSGDTKTYFTPLRLVGVTLWATMKLSVASLAERADVVVVGKPHPMNGLAALITRFIRPGTRLILDVDDDEAASNRLQAGWQKRCLAWFETFTSRQAAVVTANTHFSLHRLAEGGTPREKLVYLPNGIDPARFPPADPDRAQKLRSALGLDSRKVIGYIGSMSLGNHAVDLLLYAFVRVLRTIPEATLLLVGGGEDLESVKKLSQSLGIWQETRFIGRVPPDEVPLYYAISDVSVDPVRDDEASRARCPLKMFESWAVGIPFVTADVGDRRLLAGQPPAACLSEPGDPNSLAERITAVLKSPSIANSLRTQGASKVVEYSWNHLILRVAPFLRRSEA